MGGRRLGLDRLHVGHLPVVEGGGAVGIALPARLLMSHRAGRLDQQVKEASQLQPLAGELPASRARDATRPERDAGRLINRLLLPGAPPNWPELAWAVYFRPIDPLGGDYYDSPNRMVATSACSLPTPAGTVAGRDGRRHGEARICRSLARYKFAGRRPSRGVNQQLWS